MMNFVMYSYLLLPPISILPLIPFKNFTQFLKQIIHAYGKNSKVLKKDRSEKLISPPNYPQTSSFLPRGKYC